MHSENLYILTEFLCFWVVVLVVDIIVGIILYLFQKKLSKLLKESKRLKDFKNFIKEKLKIFARLCLSQEFLCFWVGFLFVGLILHLFYFILDKPALDNLPILTATSLTVFALFTTFAYTVRKSAENNMQNANANFYVCAKDDDKKNAKIWLQELISWRDLCIPNTAFATNCFYSFFAMGFAFLISIFFDIIRTYFYWIPIVIIILIWLSIWKFFKGYGCLSLDANEFCGKKSWLNWFFGFLSYGGMPRYHDNAEHDNTEFLQGLRYDLFGEALRLDRNGKHVLDRERVHVWYREGEHVLVGEGREVVDRERNPEPYKALEKLEKALHYLDYAVHLNKVLKEDAKNELDVVKGVVEFKDNVKKDENFKGIKDIEPKKDTKNRFDRIENYMDEYMKDVYVYMRDKPKK